MKRTRERLLASSMICGVALLGVATPAAAQTGGADEVSEVVVTGTRIPSPNLESVSPVTAVSAADIRGAGVTRVEDMINSLPQAFAAQGSALSNGSTGTATVSLRGLGATRTQVLIDGRRLMPGTPNTLGGSLAPDLNFIPSALIERVDVLTGGASAVYGADAVAGVVNFIMSRNFEGIRVDAQYGLYQHDNGNAIADVVRAKAATAASPEFFRLPKGNVRDGESSQVTLILGVNSPDGKGNVTAYAGYRHVEPIFQGNRDFSACTLNSGATFAAAGCGGSGTAFPARFGANVVDITGPGNTFRPRVAARDVFNFGPQNYYQRPDDRYVLGAFANYEINDWATAYMDVMFMDDTSTYQIAAGGIFAGTFSVNCANPFLSAQQRGLLGATAASGGGTCATNPGGTFTGTIARRNVEGGGRQGTTQHQQYRYVVGMRGALNDNWNYDFAMQYGRVSFGQIQTGFFRTGAINNALNVVSVNGVPTCASVVNGTDLACVPYNIMQLGGVTPAALNYLETPATQTGNLFERVVNFNIGGDLTEYGVKMPWAKDGVGVSIGAEYRRETMDYQADFVAASGQLNGAGGANPPVNGSFDVYEVFAEARVPILQDAPLAKSLTFETAFRYSDYSSVGTTETYKLAGDWEPVDGLRVRGGYNRAVRAPHILELFSPRNVALDGTQDPCAGLAANDPLVARCASLFNLTTAQVLAIEANPAAQYNGRFAGNTNLDPETSDTYTLGLVLQPSFLPGFNASIDWFDIKVKDYISNIGADVIINRCVGQQDRSFCALVNRDAQGSIWLSNQGFVDDQTVNIGSIRTTGFDMNVGYRLNLDEQNMGSMSFNFVGTYLDKLEAQALPGDDAFDCAGLYGTICSVSSGFTSPNPKWRHKARVTWATPLEYGEWFKNFSVSLQWRHFDKVTLDAYDDHPQLNNPGIQYATDKTLASRDYFDLTASWTMRDNLNFRAGVNNLFDKDPPLTGSSNCPSGPCNGNTWPQVYDSFGRYLFIGLTADF
ncbi:MAG: TonB-dependent receptor [Alphaproteobacteria bacterium]|nr:TonB-dependent receptor [Alphaproteobacteria bacterium]MBU1517126.1 TonB-dependent receptor [Alphaproteobacteria bacterium]MBU2093745.1 TonB-dependent receptor [Alphaproteobacteria bacterium]MBU2153933.1 TonB-dependent receptor [Alphaproteobacteria bacterium]MBU2308655.1 TonB-dependent receptor [Alphaproteobacteria bacterium]